MSWDTTAAREALGDYPKYRTCPECEERVESYGDHACRWADDADDETEDE